MLRDPKARQRLLQLGTSGAKAHLYRDEEKGDEDEAIANWEQKKEEGLLEQPSISDSARNIDMQKFSSSDPRLSNNRIYAENSRTMGNYNPQADKELTGYERFMNLKQKYNNTQETPEEEPISRWESELHTVEERQKDARKNWKNRQYAESLKNDTDSRDVRVRNEYKLNHPEEKRTPEEELEYANKWLSENLTEEQRAAVDEYVNATGAYRNLDNGLGFFDTKGQMAEVRENQMKIHEASEKLKASGISDKKDPTGNSQLDFAIQYAREAKDAQYSEEFAKKAQEETNGNFLKSAGLTAVSAFSNVVNGVPAVAESFRKRPDRQSPVNTNSDLYRGQKEAQAIIGGISQNIKDNAKTELGGNVGSFLYGAGTSAATSMLSMFLGAGIGKMAGGAKAVVNMSTLPLFGTSAYASKLDEMQQRGITGAKAVATAAAAGISEMLTEVVSLDYAYDLVKNLGAKGAKHEMANKITDYLISNGIEGSEELVNDWINWKVDDLINGENSEGSEFIKAQMENGASEDEAKHNLMVDRWKNAGIDFLAGLVSSVFMTGPMAAVDYAGTKLNETRITTQEARDLFEQGDYESLKSNLVSGTEKADKAISMMDNLESKETNGEKISNKEYRDALKAYEEALGENLTTEEQNLENRQNMTPQEVENNNTQNIENNEQNITQFARALREAETPQELVKAEREAKAAGLDAGQIAKEVGRVSQQKGFDIEEVRQLEAVPTAEEAKQLGYEGKEAPENLDLAGKKAYNEGQVEAMKAKAKKTTVTEPLRESTATYNGKTIKINDVLEDGYYATSEGKVPATKVKFNNKGAEEVYQDGLTYKGDTRKAYYDYFPGNITPKVYNYCFDSVYTAGSMGKDFREFAQRHTSIVNTLGFDAVARIYDIAQKENTANRKAQGKRKATISNGVVVDERENTPETNDTLLNIAEGFAMKVPTPIHIGAKNLPHGALGMFKDNTIYIADNTGKEVEKISHEIGEFCKMYNAEGYEEVKQAFIDWNTATEDRENRFDRTNKAYFNRYQSAYEADHRTITPGEATDEVFNDSLGKIIFSDEGKEFVEWAYDTKGVTEANNLLDKVMQFLNNLFDHIKEFISGQTFKELGEDITVEATNKELENLRKSVLNMIDEASRKYREEAYNNLQSETQADNVGVAASYALNEKFEDAVDRIAENGATENDNHIFVGHTPKTISKIIGITEKDLIMKPSKLYSDYKTKEEAIEEGHFRKGVNYHGLHETIKELPKLLEDPMIIMKSYNNDENLGIAVIVNKLNNNNKPIVVALHPSGHGYIEGEIIEADTIATAFGKSGIENYVNTALKDNRILYINKTSQGFSSIPWIQFPDNIKNLDFSNNLSNYRELVKKQHPKRVKENLLIKANTDNIGFHAGDLGKAERYASQGKGRDTGHFGTGTYFVGNEEKLTENYKDRPQHAVNFDDYNLYKISNDEEGYKLHRALRVIDGGIDPLFVKALENDQFSAIPVDDYHYSSYMPEDISKWNNDSKIEALEKAAKKTNCKDFESFAEWSAHNKIDSEDAADYYIEEMDDRIKENAQIINEHYKEVRTAYDDLLFTVGKFNDSKLIKAIKEVADYQEKTSPNFDEIQDNLATVLMKSLGYEGVDTRNTGLDNTAYGSVIYDVKSDTVVYSLEVDTEGNKLSEGQKEYFKDSKIVDENGALKVMYHGTKNDFTIFDTSIQGGVNGTAEGYGLYFSDNKEVSNAYGDKVLKGYLNIKKPASKFEKKITKAELKKLIKTLCEEEAKQIFEEDGGYDSVKDSIKDTWISNYVDTYSEPIETAFNNVTDSILRMNSSDFDVIQEVMRGMAIRSYSQAYKFYDTLTKTIGIDGFVTEWEDSNTGETSGIVLAFNSNQFKNVDNLEPTDDPDIRYSLETDTDGNMLSMNQREYFKNSKVVDENGALKVMYHGTDAEFNVFDPSKSDDGLSMFFTDDENIAKGYGNTSKVYINVENPLHVYAENADDFTWQEALGYGLSENEKEEYFNLKNRIDSLENGDEKYALEEELQNRFYDNLGNKTTKEWSAKAKAEGYDGVIFHDIIDSASEDYYEPSNVVVVFDSNQVKRVDNQNPTDNADIRYSLDLPNYSEEVDDLIFGEDLGPMLKQGAELLKDQEVDRVSVEKVAKDIIKQTSSEYDPKKLADNLEKVLAYMQSQGEVSYNDLSNIMVEVARPVVEESKMVDPEEQRRYDEFVSYLKGISGVRLTDKQKQEVRNTYGTYKDFRNKFFGKLNISDNGSMTLDQLWSEIVEQSAGVLSLDEAEGNQPMALLETINALKPSMITPFLGDNNEAAYDVALRILHNYYDQAGNSKEIQAYKKELRDKAKDFRDKVKANYEERLAQVRQSAIDNREKVSDAILKERARARDIKKEQENKQEATKNRESIRKTANQLFNMLEKPSDKRHVPEALKLPVEQLLASIDFVSPRSKIGSSTNLKWQDMMRKLALDLKQITDNGELMDDNSGQLASMCHIIDPDLADNMAQFVKAHEKQAKLSNLSAAELKQLSQMLTGLKNAIVKSNELIGQRVDLAEVAKQSMRDMDARKERIDKNNFTRGAKDFFNLDMLDSITYFEEMGGAAKSILKEIQDGWKNKVKRVAEAQEWSDKTFEGIKDIDKWTGDKAQKFTFTTDEGSIELSVGQLMELYAHSKREQSRGHFTRGGIRSGADRARTKIIHVTPALFDEMMSKLTPEQKALTDKMQSYLSNEVADWGNNATLEAYGYKKFNEKNYWPIKTDSNSRNATDKNTSDNASLFAIRNMSASKNLTQGANNALVLNDAFDTFTNHVAQMAAYEGLMIPLSDAMKWYNYHEQVDALDEFSTRYDYGVKDSIERAFGKGGQNYFIKLMKDINGEASRDKVPSFISSMISNSKAAAVSANLRVIIQQPCAISRALNEMNGKYLLKAQPSIFKARKLAIEAQDNSMLAKWKNWGYFDNYLGKSMKQVITGQSTLKEKVQNFAASGAQLADDLTWGVLWRAVQYEIADTTDLVEGTPEFNKAVAERFDDIIDRTQVVDTVFNRSQLMRNENDLVKLSTAFMMEPSKTYNMIHRAIASGDKDKMFRAGIAYILNALITSAAASIIDALRADDDETSFAERYLKAMFGIGEGFKGALTSTFGGNINPLAQIPYIKEIFSAIEGYDAGRMDVAWVYDCYDAAKEVAKYANGSSNKTKLGVSEKVMKAAGEATGLPIYQAWRDIKAVYNNVNNSKWFRERGLYNLETKQPGTYDKLKKSIVTGNDIETQVQAVLDKGKEKGDIGSTLSSNYKMEYNALSKATDEESKEDFKELDANLRIAFKAAGFEDEEINTKLDMWAYGDGKSTTVYQPLYDTFEKGGDVQAEVKKLMDSGKEKSQVASAITSHYKEKLIETRDPNLKSQLIKAYMAAGYTNSDAKKKIDKWFEPKK